MSLIYSFYKARNKKKIYYFGHIFEGGGEAFCRFRSQTKGRDNVKPFLNKIILNEK